MFRFLKTCRLAFVLAFILPVAAHAETGVFRLTQALPEGLEFCDETVCLQAYPLSAAGQHQYCSDAQLVATLQKQDEDGDVGEKSRFATNEDILQVTDLLDSLSESVGTNIGVAWYLCASISPSAGSVAVVCIDPDPVGDTVGTDAYFIACVRTTLDFTTIEPE